MRTYWGSISVVALAAIVGPAHADVVVIDEDFALAEGATSREWAGWGNLYRDTNNAATGNASVGYSTVSTPSDPQEGYIRFRLGLEETVPAADLTPGVSQLTFHYRLQTEQAPTVDLRFGLLKQGVWGSEMIDGSTTLIADGQWHTGSVTLDDWLIEPEAWRQLDGLVVEKAPGSFWTPLTDLTMNIDTVTAVPTPVPEPATALTAALGLLTLFKRRRR